LGRREWRKGRGNLNWGVSGTREEGGGRGERRRERGEGGIILASGSEGCLGREEGKGEVNLGSQWG
jgi:hypothetical protein